jgi:hypothetical protein
MGALLRVRFSIAPGVSESAEEAQRLRWQAFAPNYQLPRIATLSLRWHDELASTHNRHADAWFCDKTGVARPDIAGMHIRKSPQKRA